MSYGDNSFSSYRMKKSSNRMSRRGMKSSSRQNKAESLADMFGQQTPGEESKVENKYKRPPSKERGNGSRRELNEPQSSKRGNLNKLSKRQSIIQSILEESDDEETRSKLKNGPISPLAQHERDKTLPQVQPSPMQSENLFASKSVYGKPKDFDTQSLTPSMFTPESMF